MNKINQPASGKTVLTGAAGAAVTLIVYIGAMIGFEIPVEVATAALTVITFLIAYFVPAKTGKFVDATAPDDADLLVNRDNISPDEFEDAEEVV